MWRKGDAPIGYLPDCGGPSASAILSAMSTRFSPSETLPDTPFRLLLLSLYLAAASFFIGCTRVQTAAGSAPLPQVTAAPAVARDVTEWDEFTGRLEPVQSVGIRPRVSGLISNVTFDEGSLVRPGQLLFQLDDRPFLAQVERLRAELAQATAARDRAASEMRRADRLATDNAMSLEERERRAGAATEAMARVDAVAAALRAA
jgi:membrane fusion protein, multidrug efflux system